jgi:hypothetical protein
VDGGKWSCRVVVVVVCGVEEVVGWLRVSASVHRTCAREAAGCGMNALLFLFPPPPPFSHTDPPTPLPPTHTTTLSLRSFAQGLSEAGATVYITGRDATSLAEACSSVPGPGACIGRVVDSADDAWCSSLTSSQPSLANTVDDASVGREAAVQTTVVAASGFCSSAVPLGVTAVAGGEALSHV